MATAEDKKITIDEELHQKLRDSEAKQEGLRGDFINEKAQAQATMKSNLKQMTREKYDAEAREAWSAVDKWVKENAGIKGQQSYVEYGTSMMDLCAGYQLLNKALAYDNMFERGMKYVWNQTIGSTKLGQDIERAAHSAKELPGDLLDQGLRKIHLKKDKLPEIVYKVMVDEDGKLMTQVTKNGEPLSPEQKLMFDTGLVAWAEARDCTFDPATGILTDENDDIMTPEKFIELNEGDENGLDAYFEGRFNLEVSSAPRP